MKEWITAKELPSIGEVGKSWSAICLRRVALRRTMRRFGWSFSGYLGTHRADDTQCFVRVGATILL